MPRCQGYRRTKAQGRRSPPGRPHTRPLRSATRRLLVGSPGPAGPAAPRRADSARGVLNESYRAVPALRGCGAPQPEGDNLGLPLRERGSFPPRQGLPFLLGNPPGNPLGAGPCPLPPAILVTQRSRGLPWEAFVPSPCAFPLGQCHK